MSSDFNGLDIVTSLYLDNVIFVF